MKTTKNKIIMLIAMVLFAIALVPAVKTEAAQATPSGINLNNQSKNRVQITWNFDQNMSLLYYYDYYGYEVEFYTLKNKKFASYDSNKNDDKMIENTNMTKVGIDVTNNKFKTEGYKVRVRAFYTEDGVNYDYSNWAEKVIIPRATIKNVKKAGTRIMKVSWNKVSGAKSYTLYISSNDCRSFKKVTTTTKTSAKTKKLTMYKNYYFYVQANGVKYKKKKYNSTKPSEKVANAVGPYYFYYR